MQYYLLDNLHATLFSTGIKVYQANPLVVDYKNAELFTNLRNCNENVIKYDEASKDKSCERWKKIRTFTFMIVDRARNYFSFNRL